MIEVVLFRSGRRIDRVEAEGPENALYAARTIHDEARSPARGGKLSVGFYVEGQLVRLIDGRP